jgi:tetratricopeptide (TPR) repeat protein
MQDDLAAAVSLHQSGCLEQAAQLYKGILAHQPRHPDALHLLGVVALQQGHPGQALQLIERAIAISPGVAAFHCNLAEAYRALGEANRAAASCRVALRLEPGYAEAANNLGLALLAQGKVPEAVEQLGAALRLSPGAAMVHNNLGNALRTQGDAAGAIAAFQRALQLDPRLAEAHSNLGQLHLEKHRVTEALFHCGEAVRLRPGLADAHNNLGNALRESGRVEEAKACYAEALRLNPRLAMACNNMGQADQEQGNLEQAIAWYERGLQLEPGSARIHVNLASTLEEQEKHDEARAHFTVALQLDPTYAEAQSGVGYVLQEQGDFAQALARYREALRLKPDLVGAHLNLGSALEELGDFEAALGCFREALRHEPDHAGALARVATLLRDRLPREEQERLEHLLGDPTLTDGERSALHFGLAQVHDARAEFADAARHLEPANALARTQYRKRGKGYDAADHTRFIDNLMAAFSSEFFQRTRGFGLNTERPVFILGLPRSGTTLTERILASHPRAFGAGELSYMREAFESMPRIMNRTATPAMECVRELDRKAADELARHYLDRVGALNAEALRVTDKMPDNYLYLGLVATLFPRVRVVHCRRDLRDVAVSCWLTNFRHVRWASGPSDIVARFRDYQHLMDHWRQVLPVPLLEVDYEETVTDLEAVARRLVEWCGLEWDPGCLAFHQSRQPVRTASLVQVRQPVYTRSVNRWKNYESALAPLFIKL